MIRIAITEAAFEAANSPDDYAKARSVRVFNPSSTMTAHIVRPPVESPNDDREAAADHKDPMVDGGANGWAVSVEAVRLRALTLR